MEEYTTPFAGLTPTQLPRLGAGYFSGRDAFGRNEKEPLSGQVSPLLTWTHSPGVLKLPSRLYFQTAPKSAGYEAVLKEEENPRALDLTYVCDATTRRAANISRALVSVQLRQVRSQIFFCIFSIVCSFYNFVYFAIRVRADAVRIPSQLVIE